MAYFNPAGRNIEQGGRIYRKTGTSRSIKQQNPASCFLSAQSRGSLVEKRASLVTQ